MIPIRDVIPSRTTPIVTFSLIIANALAFLYQVSLSPTAGASLVHTFGMQPSYLSSHLLGASSATLVTAMFFHLGWTHLIGNLLFLWIFGNNVEDRFGHLRFLAFYLLAGMGANLIQVWHTPNLADPVIGASGAIAAVMGAYLVLFPKSRVVMLIWLVFYVDFVEIPAVLFLGFWFLFQFAGGLGPGAVLSGIAFAAHIGGFAIGALSGRLLARPERIAVSWWDLSTP